MRIIKALPFVYYSVRASADGDDNATGASDEYEYIQVGENDGIDRMVDDMYVEYIEDNTDSGEAGFEEAPTDSDIDDDDEIIAYCEDMLAETHFDNEDDEEDALIECALDNGWTGEEDHDVTYDCVDETNPQCNMRSAEGGESEVINDQFPANDAMQEAILLSVMEQEQARIDAIAAAAAANGQEEPAITRRVRQKVQTCQNTDKNGNITLTSSCIQKVANQVFDVVSLRRVNGRKKKRRKPKKTVPAKPVQQTNKKVGMHHGGISAFREGIVSYTAGVADNCERGWHADGKICANTCRVKWISGNPLEQYENNEEHFYRKNPFYARCEACLLWSGLAGKRKVVLIQKSLYQLKAGAPTYCDPETNEVCKDKEHRFAACMGTAVCADVCWSPAATMTDCMACRTKWCDEGKDDHRKFFNLCNNFDKCMNKFPPHRYNYFKHKNPKHLITGAGCWGTPFNPEYVLQKEDYYTTVDFCNSVIRGWSLAYPKYLVNHGKCIEASCDPDHKDYNQKRCNDMKCSKKCLNGAGYSDDCLECEYNIKDPVNQNCKRDKTYNACRQPLVANNCYRDCTKFAEQRAARGDLSKFVQSEYEEYMEKCGADRCFTYFPKTCGACIDKCADQGEREYTSALGSNSFRKNYEGWGCLALCKTKNIIMLAKQDKVEYNRETMEIFIASQMAGGTSSQSAQALVVNTSGKRRKRRRGPRGKRDTRPNIRQRTRSMFNVKK